MSIAHKERGKKHPSIFRRAVSSDFTSHQLDFSDSVRRWWMDCVLKLKNDAFFRDSFEILQHLLKVHSGLNDEILWRSMCFQKFSLMIVSWGSSVYIWRPFGKLIKPSEILWTSICVSQRFGHPRLLPLLEILLACFATLKRFDGFKMDSKLILHNVAALQNTLKMFDDIATNVLMAKW